MTARVLLLAVIFLIGWAEAVLFKRRLLSLYTWFFGLGLCGGMDRESTDNGPAHRRVGVLSERCCCFGVLPSEETEELAGHVGRANCGASILS